MGSESLRHRVAGAEVVFTTRAGGVSTGPYESLNLGPWTDDDPAAVEANRRRVADELGVRLAGVHQVHGTKVVQAGSGAQEADAVWTREPGIAPTVLVADCLPVALVAPGAVGMVHCGWRGLAGGIIARAAESLGAAPIAAVIGPGARACCYEVGEDVHAAFHAAGASVRRGRNLDLPAIATRQLRTVGVTTVEDAETCTMCDSRFFSHRRDGGVTGRQAGIAWLV